MIGAIARVTYMIKVFHAGYVEIPVPDIKRGRINADFGQGFYLSDNYDFASLWVRERNRTDIIVNSYELDESGLNILRFDRDEKYGINLKKFTIQEAWNSAWFKVFRHTLENACPACPDRALCMGGCPLTSIALCDRKYKQCFIN